MGYQVRLMKILSAYGLGGNERYAEAPTPVSQQIGHAGSLVVLIGAQLRIGDETDWHKKESVSDTLQHALQPVMRRIGIEVHCAVDEHGESYDLDTRQHHSLRGDHSALQKLRRYGSQKSDRQRARSENQARIDGAISIQRLLHIRNQRGGTEQAHPEYEQQNT